MVPCATELEEPAKVPQLLAETGVYSSLIISMALPYFGK
jgi:hypothetical protein